ncbi:hypothetical protein VPG91_20085 [Nitrospirillum amazonense]|uniref:hypothetical protein n=1 Tax=Nitrospirillum amazonense TaxID=28077 RepID=UPI002DD43816|nr:hypothetical protein [Nitrospirillum amazonense]MEC4593314.1 hypothetical protein [Nitrospirillum amazonense]
MRVKVQFLLPVIGVAALGGVLVAAGQVGQDRAARVAQSLDQARTTLVQATDVRAISRAVQRDALNTLLEPAADRGTFVERASVRLTEMGLLVAGLRDRAADAAFLAPQAQALTEMTAMVTAVRGGDEAGALTRLRTTVGPLDAQAAGLAQAFIDTQGQVLDGLAADAGHLQAQTSRLAAWGGVLGTAAAMMMSALFLLALLRRPLARWAGAGNDDLRAVVAAAARGDELGDWARALVALRDQAKQRGGRPVRAARAKVSPAVLAA